MTIPVLTAVLALVAASVFGADVPDVVGAQVRVNDSTVGGGGRSEL